MWVNNRYFDMTNLDSLQKAINAVGGQHALAKICKTSQPRIWNWLNRDKKVPAEYVLIIEKATGVPRNELRSDLYPLEDHNQVA
jgi:DNA-binding transcriptional regulator YdaS (Cro superfamily)